jgi:hypothetical protein
MDDRISIDVVDACHEALLEFLFGGDADVAQDRTGQLGEEALDKVEPGAGFTESVVESGARAFGSDASYALARTRRYRAQPNLSC